MGRELKASLTKPGPWYMDMWGFGECLPYRENRVTLNRARRDAWGLPLLSITCEYRENEARMREDLKASAAEMLGGGGLKYVQAFGEGSTPGSAIHEMGTARMGRDPKTSVLNAHNQVHAAPNIFVTDGACMTSSACQNPSFTYMALTARAAAHAVDELRRGRL